MANLGSTLQAPGYMQVQNGDYLSSVNGDYFAVIQRDGNLCIYPGTYPGPGDNSVWCALHASQCEAVYFVAMQADGNLCVYSGIGGPQGGEPAFYANPNQWAVWCSQSNQPSPPITCYLVLEGDGDLNIYEGTPDDQGSLLWSARHS